MESSLRFIKLVSTKIKLIQVLNLCVFSLVVTTNLFAQNTITFDAESFTNGQEIPDNHSFFANGKTFNIFAGTFNGGVSGEGGMFFIPSNGSELPWYDYDTQFGDGGFVFLDHTSDISRRWYDPEALIIKTTDGSDFKFTSFKSHDAGFDSWGNYLKVSGYKDGVLLGSESIKINSDVPPWYSTVTLTNPVFDGVDEVRITLDKANHPNYPYEGDTEMDGLYHSFDTFVVDNAVASNSVPTVTSSAASSITTTAATLSGNVTNDGGDPVFERGFVYNTTGTPTTSDSKLLAGSGTGTFTVDITGLDPESTYYVRAYAINSQGTSYGSEVIFTTIAAPVVAGVFWFDDFENATAPSNGTRTPSNNGGSNTAYFKRTDGTNIDLELVSDGPYSGKEGIWFWAGEDHDGPFGHAEQTLVWDGIDISGKTNLSFKGLFAAQSTHPAWENEKYNYSHSDYIIIEYSIDGSIYQELMAFRGNSGGMGARQLALDTNGNSIGDGSILTKTFTEYTKSISETGNTMQIRLRASSNNTNNEEWAIDNFRLESNGAPAGVAPVASNVNFSGTLELGKTLTGSYDYADGDNDTESGSTYKWYRSDDNSGTNRTAITGATAERYTLVAADAGKYLSFEVTPNDGKAAGEAVASELQGPVHKLEATIAADAVQTFIYDGSVQNVTASLNHEETILSYSPQQGYTAAGTYPISITAEETANYKAVSEDVSLVIEKADIEGVTFTGGTFTYDGTAHSLAVAGLPEGATVIYENNDQTNAGTYKVTAMVSQVNYNDLELSADLTIKKAEATIAADAVQTFTYDGSVQNVTASLNHEETSLSYSPQQGYTAAGKYPISIVAEETANYKAVSEDVSLVIEKAEIAGVTFEGGTFTYNGTAYSLAVAGLPKGATVKYGNNGQINAGIHKVTALVSQENYNNLELSAALIIEKAEAAITADATQTFTYDGVVKNISASLNHEETVLNFGPQQGYTAAGTYPISITAEETANYKAVSEDVSLVIEKAEIEGVTFEGGTFTYNGTAHSLAVADLPVGATVKYDNNGQTNAGTYEVIATVSQENYNDLELSADLTIEKAEAAITADATQTFTYDGVVKNISASLNHEETVLNFGPQQGYTAAGTYPISITAEETPNYKAVSEDVSLVIEKAEIEGVTFEGGTFIYNGTAHSLAVAGLPKGATVTYGNNGQVSAGMHKVTAMVSKENYNDLELSAALIIEKAEAAITADAVQNFTYNGSVQNVTANLNHGETVLNFSPQQGYTAAGTYPISITAEETANYKAASEEVSLVIEKAEIEGVTFEGGTFTYNGTAHSLAVAGLPKGATVKYGNNSQINAGTYKVTAMVSQENYNDLELSAALIIEKAEAEITADAVQTFTYDGTLKNAIASLNHTETALTYSPQQGYTNAGTYKIMVSAEETDNYKAASEEVSLVIEKAEIEGVTFEGGTFTYNGAAHSLAVSGLPKGASVTYGNNNQINAGTYEVTATLSQENYNDQVLTANLVINKAAQHISFGELEAIPLRNAADFQLQASASSGLPVSYSYTYEAENPAATVSEGGLVKPMQAGKISITASQEGNQNYKEAASVSRSLTILGSHARLQQVVINGSSYASPSEEIYYLISCGNYEDEVKIQLNPIPGAEVDDEDVFVIPTPAPGIYRRNVEVTSEDGSDARTYRIKIERTFNFEDVVVQKFNNVLLVNNNPETNGGYKFEKFDWYKDGQYVGSGQYFSEGPDANDRLDANNSFHVVMTTEEGEVLQTCATIIEMKSTYEVVLTPNPVAAGGQMQLITDFPQEELETMEIFIHSLNGDLIKQLKSNKKLTSIPLSGGMAKGVYILSCKTGNRTKTLKFIVK